MNWQEFEARLDHLGIKIPKDTLRRWAYTEGVIPKPVRYKKGIGGGKGRAADWPEEAVEAACAVWAVRHNSSIALRLSPEMIATIKRAASFLYDRPYALYTFPLIVGPLLAHPDIPYEAIRVTFVSEGVEGLARFPGDTAAKKSDVLNSLIITWVAALEKVRWTKAMEEKVRHVAAWEEKLPSVRWPIRKPACVSFWWWWRPADARNGTGERLSARLYQLKGITLSESDQDDIRLYENGVDTRELFKIDATVNGSGSEASREIR